MTYFEATRVPPQNCEDPEPSIMAAIQGYLFTGLTSVPPTILDAFLTPHLHPAVVGEGVGDMADGEGGMVEGEGDAVVGEGGCGYIVGMVSGGYIEGEGGYMDGDGG